MTEMTILDYILKHRRTLIAKADFKIGDYVTADGDIPDATHKPIGRAWFAAKKGASVVVQEL